MLKKTILAAFAALFVAAIALPPLKMNLKSEQRSNLDNRMLNELPTLKDFRNGFRKKLEDALNDRIGFRNKMVLSYQKINDALFGLMVHPSYMYGSNGHLYYRAKGYINGYQNIYNKEQVEKTARCVKQLDDYLASRGIDFFYFVPPDKKTIYPEHFPKGINKSSNPPLMEVLLQRVDELGIDCVSPMQTFLELKNDIQLYNLRYDVVHWNQDGAIVGISLLLDKISGKYAEVTPLDRNKYERSMKKIATLSYKDEDIPAYELKKQYDHTTLDADLRKEVVCKKGQGQLCDVYDNAAKADGLTVLVFRDSYLDSIYRKFLTESFKRTIFIHYENLQSLTYYLNIFSPDIVILENVERMLGGIPFAAFYPHISASELALDESAQVAIEDLAVTKGAKVTSISGRAATGGDAQVTYLYAELNGKEYPAQVDKEGKFTLAFLNSNIEGETALTLTPADDGRAVRYNAVEIGL